MKIYNEEKTQVLNEYDLSLGYLKEEVRTFYQEEVVGRKEEGHYKTICEYPNGGKDVEWVVDVPVIQARPAGMVTENILIYIPYTQQELERQAKDKLIAEKQEEIYRLKDQLSSTDYKTMKWIEGKLTENEYQISCNERQNIRDQINLLDSEIEELSKVSNSVST